MTEDPEVKTYYEILVLIYHPIAFRAWQVFVALCLLFDSLRNMMLILTWKWSAIIEHYNDKLGKGQYSIVGEYYRVHTQVPIRSQHGLGYHVI